MSKEYQPWGNIAVLNAHAYLCLSMNIPLTTSAAEPSRVIHCAEALQWLGERESLPGCSLITSLPDFSEFPALSLQEWKEWFEGAARLVLSRTPIEGVTIFFQTDIKKEGEWIDKGYLCQKAAESLGIPLIWHKITCRVPSGSVTFGRPGYSHLLCFARKIRPDLARSVADILPDSGETTWTRGMGIQACRLAAGFVRDHTITRTIVDPFCGHGTVLAVANDLGLDAIGIELSPKRAKKAKKLRTEGTRFANC